MNEYKLGKVAGLSLSVEPLAIVGSILLFWGAESVYLQTGTMRP